MIDFIMKHLEDKFGEEHVNEEIKNNDRALRKLRNHAD